MRKFKPLGDLVVIRREQHDNTTKGGIMIDTSTLAPKNTATVVYAGPKATIATVGKRILVDMTQPMKHFEDGLEIVHEEHILAVFDD